MNEKIKVDALKKAIGLYNKGNISKEELESIAKNAGRKVTIWDKKEERNIYYPPGDNRSRIGFTYDPKHKKGKFMEKIIKRTIWKSVEFIHRKMLKYDENVFLFDDARLNAIQDFAFGFIDQHGAHSPPRAKLYRQMIDVCLGMCKEDLRYRSLGFQFYNEIVLALRKIDLTEGEKDNIKRWK